MLTDENIEAMSGEAMGIFSKALQEWKEKERRERKGRKDGGESPEGKENRESIDRDDVDGKFYSTSIAKCIALSAKRQEHIEELRQMLIASAHLPAISQSDVIVTNIRHYEALSHALESIHRVQQGLADNLSGDFISQDIRECIFYLSDIAGDVTNDMVLQNIFKNFCIGK